jgi:tRNA 2-thiocytidine biosynthesis protein TtcA
MYTVCRREGYGVLALAQHLDDLAESFLMSAFHGGQLRTMQAHYLNDAGDVRVIRPLAYARERQTRDFAANAGLPVIHENCPACFSMPMQRFQMKGLLAEQEKQHPQLFANLLAAMRPLMAQQGLEDALSPPYGRGVLHEPPGDG